ncbi:MAG: HEAT repeat domain-containing protein [Planctomycetes bacterium]|nr:HEAT repeat domain-containing protein [Planctomycetota bacterium]
MLAVLLAAVCSGAAPPILPDADRVPEPTFVVAQDPGAKPAKALVAWLKLYRKGKIDFRSKLDIGKDSLAAKFDVAPKNGLGDATWAGDLRLILSALVSLDDAEAARAITDVAAVGLDDEDYTYAMAPYDVRAAGLDALAGLKSDAARQALAAGARGEWKADRKEAVALRSAAMLGLGRIGDPGQRPVIEAALADGNETVRLHAIEALAALGDEQAAPALIGILERDPSDTALIATARALRKLFARYLEPPATASDTPAKPPAGAKEPDPPKRPAAPASARLAVRAAISALGRATWRADMELVRLLDEFRSTETVPALIAVLERFRDNPDDVKSGKLSGLLQAQVHELLVSMTGAVYPASQPEKWRELWDKEKDRLEVAQKREPKQDGHTVAAGFAGIPVEGTRVVFVLDLSGSMEWPMEDVGTDGKKREMNRLDFAKRELLKAIDGLPPDSQFNLVTFNGDSKAETWSKKMVPANERNRERFKKHVEKLRPLGGTNLWSGMEAALDIKSLVYGNHYETNVDEVFVLSDGAPTVGEVIDPVEILRLVEELNRYAEVRINTVFISSKTPPEMLQAEMQMSLRPKDLMRRMAEQNGGRFRDV